MQAVDSGLVHLSECVNRANGQTRRRCTQSCLVRVLAMRCGHAYFRRLVLPSCRCFNLFLSRLTMTVNRLKLHGEVTLTQACSCCDAQVNVIHICVCVSMRGCCTPRCLISRAMLIGNKSVFCLKFIAVAQTSRAEKSVHTTRRPRVVYRFRLVWTKH